MSTHGSCFLYLFLPVRTLASNVLEVNQRGNQRGCFDVEGTGWRHELIMLQWKRFVHSYHTRD